ncbi:hypothetical protein AAU61_15355 [Desulfocarbo indianensis]|nr:hypothetical protein AAU61_15355 [Desulfocarbo indianensis]
MSPTLRQTLALILQREPRSAVQLAEELLLTQGEVEHHLEHLKRSHKANFKVRPAKCASCGYDFKKRARLDAPGRCPRCRAERVDGPWFSLEP